MPARTRKESGRAEALPSFLPSVCLKDAKTLHAYKREVFSGPKHWHPGQATCPFLSQVTMLRRSPLDGAGLRKQHDPGMSGGSAHCMGGPGSWTSTYPHS